MIDNFFMNQFLQNIEPSDNSHIKYALKGERGESKKPNLGPFVTLRKDVSIFTYRLPLYLRYDFNKNRLNIESEFIYACISKGNMSTL